MEIYRTEKAKYFNILNGYFITILSEMAISCRQIKNRKDVGELNSTINALHITKVSMSPQPEMTEKDFFHALMNPRSITFWTIKQIKIIAIPQCLLGDQSEIKLENNDRKIAGKFQKCFL